MKAFVEILFCAVCFLSGIYAEKYLGEKLICFSHLLFGWMVCRFRGYHYGFLFCDMCEKGNPSFLKRTEKSDGLEWKLSQ